jgi:hypothetical protein
MKALKNLIKSQTVVIKFRKAKIRTAYRSSLLKTFQNKFLSRENLHEVNSSGIKVYLCIIFLDNRMEFSN